MWWVLGIDNLAVRPIEEGHTILERILSRYFKSTEYNGWMLI